MSSVRETVIDTLLTQAKSMISSTDYEYRFGNVTLDYSTWLTDLDTYKCALMIRDLGNEEVLDDGTDTRFTMSIGFRLQTTGNDPNDLVARTSGLLATIKEWINGGPSLGSAVLDFRLIDIQAVQFMSNRTDQHAMYDVMTELRYVCTNGTY